MPTNKIISKNTAFVSPQTDGNETQESKSSSKITVQMSNGEYINIGDKYTSSINPNLTETPRHTNKEDSPKYVDQTINGSQEFAIEINSLPTTLKEWCKKQYGDKKNILSFKEALAISKGNKLNDEIKESLKNTFGIVDGDINNNKQGALGTCHVLAALDAFSNNNYGQNLIKEIIKQNNNGTVTITFKGVLDESGKPIQIDVKNSDIAKSYFKDTDEMNPMTGQFGNAGGSSDPDAAAVEIAYIKLNNIAIKKIKFLESENIDLAKKIEDVASQIFNPEERFMLQGKLKRKEISKKEYDEKLRAIEQQKETLKKEKEQFEIKIEQNKSQIKKLQEDFGHSGNENEITNQNGFDTLGGTAKRTFEQLTGKKAVDITGENKSILIKNTDNFLKNTNIHKTPAIVAFSNNNPAQGIQNRHAYSIRNIIKTQNGEISKVLIHNPWEGAIISLDYDIFKTYLHHITYLENTNE